jgi:hypothetical protein
MELLAKQNSHRQRLKLGVKHNSVIKSVCHSDEDSIASVSKVHSVDSDQDNQEMPRLIATKKQSRFNKILECHSEEPDLQPIIRPRKQTVQHLQVSRDSRAIMSNEKVRHLPQLNSRQIAARTLKIESDKLY